MEKRENIFKPSTESEEKDVYLNSDDQIIGFVPESTSESEETEGP